MGTVQASLDSVQRQTFRAMQQREAERLVQKQEALRREPIMSTKQWCVMIVIVAALNYRQLLNIASLVQDMLTGR